MRDQDSIKGLGEIFFETPEMWCDLCGKRFDDCNYFVDGKLKDYSIWANMCSHCFLKQGKGFGLGIGQLYERQPDGKWLLIAGVPS